MASMTIELSEYVIDAIADAVVKKMQEKKTEALNKIRAEIMKLDDINPDYPMDRTIHINRNEVLQIIDKYRADRQ